MAADRPDPQTDPFRPPDIPIEVHCVHCGQEFESYLMSWEEEKTDQGLAGFWCCPTPGCDGRGFGFDIFPTDPDWEDPRGELEISYDGEDSDDEDGDEDDQDDEDEDDDEFTLDFEPEGEEIDGESRVKDDDEPPW